MPPGKKQCSRRCCVLSCKNTSANSPNVHFYRFPNASFHKYKQERRDKWISLVRRINTDGSPWRPHGGSRICSQHFINNEKSESDLSPSYNPSIFPAVYHKSQVSVKSATAATERFKRMIKRRKITNVEACCSSTNSEFTPQTPHTEVVQDQVFDEAGSRDDAIPRNADQGTQVDFIADDNMDKTFKIFTCNTYIYVDSYTSNAEVQAYIPELAARDTFIVKKRNTATKSCGTTTPCEDKAVGTETYNDQQMLDLAGVTQHSYQFLLKYLPACREVKISKENRLLIFLFKVKCGLTFSALSVLFAVPRRTVSRIFITTLQQLAETMKDIVFWPSKEIVQATMPPAFQETYSNCRVIIDCTEFRVEQPSTVQSRVNLYSHYKKGFTLKVLVGCTPSGAISFISKCRGGRTTDAQITSDSGFLELLEPGDIVLADKGFPQIKTKLDESGRGVLLVMPPFLHNNTFSAEEVHETYKVASVRIHIERIMQRLRIYRILDKFTMNMLPYCDQIVLVCGILVNLQPPIIKESDTSCKRH